MVSAKLSDPVKKPVPSDGTDTVALTPNADLEAAANPLAPPPLSPLVAMPTSSSIIPPRRPLGFPPGVPLPLYYHGKRRILMGVSGVVFALVVVTFVWIVVMTNGGDETYYSGYHEFDQLFSSLKVSTKFRASVLAALIMGGIYQLLGFLGAKLESITLMIAYTTLCVSTLLASYLRLGLGMIDEDLVFDPDAPTLGSSENGELGFLLIVFETVFSGWLLYDMYIIRKTYHNLRPSVPPVVLIY